MSDELDSLKIRLIAAELLIEALYVERFAAIDNPKIVAGNITANLFAADAKIIAAHGGTVPAALRISEAVAVIVERALAKALKRDRSDQDPDTSS